MSALVALDISAPRDITKPFDEPPSGVSVTRATRKMGLGGVEVLALSVLIEIGKAALPVLATWIYDTYRSAEKGQAGVTIIVNGNVHVASGEDDLVQILRDQEGLDRA